MAYVPNPADVTQPTDAVAAETAQAEFRAIKQALLNLSIGTGGKLAKRQTVLTGPIDTSGNAAPIAISGTVLGVDLKATGAPQGTILSWANGFNAQGANETVQVFSLDIANFWANLPVNNTSYLAADFVSLNPATNPIAVQTLAPPQYGKLYDQTAQSVLHFDAGNGVATFLDDFGNTWTAHGGAKCQTGTIKFGASALGGAGGGGQLNGAADYISSANQTLMPPMGWSLRAWVNPSVLPSAINTQQTIFGQASAAGWGIECGISENGAGAIKFYFALSSNNSSYDIANLVQGTTTPVVGTWYFLELTYDALAGTYRMYVNGVQENFANSTLRTVQGNGLTIGSRAGVAAFFNGFVDEFEFLPYCQHPNGTAYAVPTGAQAITAAGYASDWFDTSNYVMNSLVGGAASVTAGVNPTFTQKIRLYIGEADTSAGAVTAVRGYAYNGKFHNKFLNNAVNSLITLAHNMGVPREQTIIRYLGRFFGGVQRFASVWEEISAFSTYAFPMIAAATTNSNAIENDRNVVRMETPSQGILLSGTASTAAFDILLDVERAF